MKKQNLILVTVFLSAILMVVQKVPAQYSNEMQPLLLVGGDLIFQEFVNNPAITNKNTKSKEDIEKTSHFKSPKNDTFISNDLRVKGPNFQVIDNSSLIMDEKLEISSFEFVEENLELEDWMLDYAWIENENITEDELIMEDWMIQPKSWNAPTFE